MLTVTTPATDYQLLSTEELRAAVGVTGNTRDAELATLGLQVASAITAACGVVASGTTIPTLREEVLEETIRLRYGLPLARRPIVSVSSVVEAGSTLTTDDYEIADGRLVRVAGEVETTWAAGKIVVAYTAGWATVPADLKLAASKMMALGWSQATRDPLAKSERIRTEGVEEIQTDYWVGPLNGSALPADVMDLLGPYIRNFLVG
jgi:hypothetical protein